MANQFQTVRGTYDILPASQVALRRAESLFIKLAEAASFSRIDTPAFEDIGVFSRGVGEATDIVEKELYAFDDRSGNQVALRPDLTAPIARAYLQHGMASWPQPVKLYYSAPAWRYERPQAGRQRQFNQLGVEVLGSASASIDAEIILLAGRFFKQLGLQNLNLQINSIGDGPTRRKYIKELESYLSDYRQKLPEADAARLATNPLRVVDSKDEKTRAIIKNGPQILDYLSRESQAHFTEVLEYLDELGVTYELNPFLVRGLDYYTHTVFEFNGARGVAQNSLGGGGRYDGLVEQMGGKHTPAAGFGIGLERTMLELKSLGVKTPASYPQVFVVSLGEPARVGAFVLTQQLLEEGLAVEATYGKGNIGSQLAKADKAGAPYALIMGQKEVFEGNVIVRDMKNSTQEVVPRAKAAEAIKKRLGA